MAKTKRTQPQSNQQRKPGQAASTDTAQTNQANRAEASRATARVQVRNERYRHRGKVSNRSGLLIGITLLILVAVIGYFIWQGSQGSSNAINGSKPTDATVLKAINNVDPAVMSAVNAGGLKTPLVATQKSPPVLKGPTGKPEFFYDGAEYCPYCAAQRWPTAVALSHFGTFTKLPETTSSSSDVYPSTSTVTFYGSAYTSTYIDFVSVEETTNQSDGNGGYVALQTPTADEALIVNTYNAAPYTTSPGIPFISIANQYLELGPAFSPNDLAGLSQSSIASDLSNSGSPVAKDILGGANYLIAAICATTNNQPASVCTTGVIPALVQSLPKATASVHSSSTLLGALPGLPAAITRRED